MKKTISINISGVIFHIEEDGYDKLKNYLTSIQQYFATYEDSQEIITDIENRIAEKLHNKLKADNKQVISLEDIEQLMRSMGTVADFEAVEEEEVLVGATRAEGRSAGTDPGARAYEQATGGTVPPSGQATSRPRRLYRDLKRKVVGGVASGVAHYFSIDPVWIRLALVALVLSSPAGQEAGVSFSGFLIILYIAMWIAFPGSTTLEEDKTVKKFYRNPDDKVLGGVASGIGAYFGVDTGLVRLLMVLSIFLFGTGLLAYIVLWIIAPVANTMTEKMEMKGQPITLTNIEHNVKRSLNINETAEESTLTKVLLFPFRLIAAVFNGLGRAIGPLAVSLGAIIRVLVGVFLVIVGGSIMLAALAGLGAALGMKGVPVQTGDFPIELFRQDFSVPMILSAFAALFIPGLALTILGVTLISRRAMVSSRVNLAMLSIWFLSLIGLAMTVPPLVADFRRSGIVEEATPVAFTGTPTLALNNLDDEGFNASIELEGYAGPGWKVVKRLRAQGASRQDAQENARATVYNFSVKDSTATFDDEYELKPGSRFRGQNINVQIYVPYEQPFRMTPEFARRIQNEFGRTELDRMTTTLWKFTKDNGLVSLSGPRELDRDDDFDTDDAVDRALRSELGDDFYERSNNTRQFEAANFNKVDIGGAFAVRIRKGDTFKVVGDGREEDLDDLRVRVEGGELTVELKNDNIFGWTDRQRMGLTITMPDVQRVQFSGATRSSITGFDSLSRLEVSLSGACNSLVDVNARDLKLEMSGASRARLRGRSEQVEARLSGACKLDATDARVSRARVDASGASRADFGEVDDLSSSTSGASKVTGQERRGNVQ